jgi:hypothetical protein
VEHKGLNQLLCAAVVNEHFRQTLLRSPAQALAAGYMGQLFSLTSEERALVVDIRAQHLEDFAAQVYCWISGNGDGLDLHKRDAAGSSRSSMNGHRNGSRTVAERFTDLKHVPVPAL